MGLSDPYCCTIAVVKTTVEINDVLLRRAKAHAVEHGTTLRSLIEEGLRRTLDGPAEPPKERWRVIPWYGSGEADDPEVLRAAIREAREERPFPK